SRSDRGVRTRPLPSVPRRAPVLHASALALAALLAHSVSFAADTVSSLNAASDTYLAPKGKPKGHQRTLLAAGTFTPLVRFDLSSIPTTSIIRVAKLRLFVVKFRQADGAAALTIRQVTGAWSEQSATGQNPPSMDSVVQSTNSVDGGKLRTFVEWDITPVVQAWVAGS